MFDKYTKAIVSCSAQMIKHAKSGHIGMAISASPIYHALFVNHLNICKKYPKWFNRDRFVLSAGHGSAGLYSILYFGGALTKEDIKCFRHGKTDVAGHPEYSPNNFIDASTGPLGQGLANGVGMAIAEKYLNKRWSKLSGLVDHYTYVLVGDGDLQEGISYEAMSIAGKLKLNKLIVLHDSNNYQLDSAVCDVNVEDIKLRVESQKWKYLSCDNNVENISKAIETAKANPDSPTFIEVKTIIGEGTSQANSNKAHSLQMSSDEIHLLDKYFDMKSEDFKFENEIHQYFKDGIFNKGENKYNQWFDLISFYQSQYPELVHDFLNKIDGQFEDFSQYLDIEDVEKFDDSTKSYLKVFFKQLSNVKDIMTLSADVSSTTNCMITNNNKAFNEDVNSPYVMMGIREFAMGAIQNGILLHGGLKCISGTFLSFSDYIKPAIRLGAMCHLPSTYVFTHDSYFVGNDGPTHQPYDQLPMLRAIENVYVWRPCDEKETFAALVSCLNSHKRTNCLVLTRQSTKSYDATSVNNSYYGAYIFDDDKEPDITIIANGSELELATNIKRALYSTFNLHVKIVSCPCLKEFLNQNADYIKNTLQSEIGVIAIEASSDNYWFQLQNYCKRVGVIQATRFGFSDDGKKVYEKLGFNVDDIVDRIKVFINHENL